MARITVEDCLEIDDNPLQLVLVATKRARQITNGADPLVPEDNDKPTVIALREIAEGLVTPAILDEEDTPPEMTAFDRMGTGEAGAAGLFGGLTEGSNETDATRNPFAPGPEYQSDADADAALIAALQRELAAAASAEERVMPAPGSDVSPTDPFKSTADISSRVETPMPAPADIVDPFANTDMIGSPVPPEPESTPPVADTSNLLGAAPLDAPAPASYNTPADLGADQGVSDSELLGESFLSGSTTSEPEAPVTPESVFGSTPAAEEPPREASVDETPAADEATQAAPVEEPPAAPEPQVSTDFVSDESESESISTDMSNLFTSAFSSATAADGDEVSSDDGDTSASEDSTKLDS